jgi:hypothetical protein
MSIFDRISQIGTGIGATSGLAAKYFGGGNNTEAPIIADRIAYGQLNGSGPNNIFDALKAPSSIMGFLLGNDNVGNPTPATPAGGIAGNFNLTSGGSLMPLLVIGLILWLILRR